MGEGCVFVAFHVQKCEREHISSDKEASQAARSINWLTSSCRPDSAEKMQAVCVQRRRHQALASTKIMLAMQLTMRELVTVCVKQEPHGQEKGEARRRAPPETTTAMALGIIFPGVT